MTDNFIKLNKSDVLTLGIKTNDGKDTGEFLEFDLEDIELPLKYQELLEKDKKNKERLRNQILINENIKNKFNKYFYHFVIVTKYICTGRSFFNS